jgi:hypothetical protein
VSARAGGTALSIKPPRTLAILAGESLAVMDWVDILPLVAPLMLHINRRNGFTIGVSEAKYIAPIAKRTILSEDALSVLIPILADIVGWEVTRIRALFEAHGLLIHEWDKVRTIGSPFAKVCPVRSRRPQHPFPRDEAAMRTIPVR